eukprot:gnl/Chilomastix_caulleri/5193.p1 GENE.gnl/Chilomastix_caulleri/5193~~gnl/Chilomastix_caulleri/5193.p1  ORF type:complete len:85 (-),score=9.01 gnl/Chilomastix_caulleri/5193:245-499(-)
MNHFYLVRHVTWTHFDQGRLNSENGKKILSLKERNTLSPRNAAHFIELYSTILMIFVSDVNRLCVMKQSLKLTIANPCLPTTTS